MNFLLMSTRIAQIASLVFLVTSSANAAIINRLVGGDQSAEIVVGDIMHMAKIIGEGHHPEDVVIYGVLEDILAPSAKSTRFMAPVRKRTCYFNAGMSHSCDYNEVLKTVDDVNHWSSDSTPGKRRKRQHFPTRRGRRLTRSLDGRLPF